MNIQNDILCPECGKDFGTLPRFHKHFRQYHKKNESKCTSCEKTFNTAYILRQHVTNVHETKKCDICDLDFAKGALARHKRIHLETKFECEQCGNVFTRKDKLQTHKRICGTDIVKVVEAPVTINCETCGKTFTQKRYLKQHKRTHIVQKTAVQYDCKLCDKTFASNQSLGNHISKHHPNPRRVENASVGFILLESSPPRNSVPKKPEKTFSCKQCPYISGRKDNFKRHIESHTSNKVKTGRPKKSPGEWSKVTKRLYAKKSQQEFEENMKEYGLSEDLEKLLKKDSRLKEPALSKMTEKEVINMIADFDLSDIKMLNMLRRLKSIFGKKAFTPGIAEALIERKKQLTKYFKEEETTFVNGEGEEVQRRFVFTESLDILLEFIIQGRDLDSDKVKVNVEQDSGQQRMLVVLQIGDEIEKTVKDTSTKRGIIIAFVDDIPENYRNLSIIHNKLKIHLIPHHYKIVSDLKLYNIILGLMECGSRHGCYICKGLKNAVGVWDKGELRHLDDLIATVTLWEEESGLREKLKEYHNVQHVPLLQTPTAKLLDNDHSDTLTLTLTPPPPLHVIKLGPVNHLWNGLSKHHDMAHIEKLLGLTKSDKQKKAFQGPECDKILRNLDFLQACLPEELHTFVEALRQVGIVYQISTARSVVSNHREIIQNFKHTWITLMENFGITMPLKVHIIVDHLSDYFELSNQTLKDTNDQFIEACHAKVKKFFDNHPNYKFKDKNSDAYGEALLAAIVHFNSNNLGFV